MESIKFTKKTRLNIISLEDYFGISPDVNTNTDTANVTYSMQLNTWSGGLMGIDVTIESITSSIEWSVEDSELTDAERLILKSKGGRLYTNKVWEGVFEFEQSDKKSEGFKIFNQCFFQENGSYEMSEVTIDYRKVDKEDADYLELVID